MVGESFTTLIRGKTKRVIVPNFLEKRCIQEEGSQSLHKIIYSIYIYIYIYNIGRMI